MEFFLFHGNGTELSCEIGGLVNYAFILALLLGTYNMEAVSPEGYGLGRKKYLQVQLKAY